MIRRAAALSVVCGLLLLAGTPGSAQDDKGKAPSEVTAQYQKAMKEMNQKMRSAKKTGDADHDFIVMMIEHHKGAIAMAETLLKSGSHAELLQMVEKQIKTQKEEIAKLEKILGELGGAKDSESGGAAKSSEGENK